MRVRRGVAGVAAGEAAVGRAGHDPDRLPRVQRVLVLAHPLGGELLHPEHHAAAAGGGQDRAGVHGAVQGAAGAPRALRRARLPRAVRRRRAGP